MKFNDINVGLNLVILIKEGCLLDFEWEKEGDENLVGMVGEF